jgi:hypothetical protein
MPKLKPLIYMFFFAYFLSYCAYNKITLLREYKQQKESYYDLSHIEIYKTSHYKNKYVGLQKGNVFKIL